MLKILGKNGDCAERESIIHDLKRLVRINDEKNQLLIHMACQKVRIDNTCSQSNTDLIGIRYFERKALSKC